MALRFPKSNQPIVDSAGNGTRPWLDYFRNLQSIDVTVQIEEQIQQILDELADIDTDDFLPSTTNIFGQNSIVTFGTLADGIVLAQLQNDVNTPYAFQYYGVDGSSNRGWRWLYDALAAGTGIVKTMDGYTVLGVLGSTGELPGTGTAGDAYLISGHLWAWDGAAWQDEGDASGVTMFSLAELPNSGMGQSPIKIYTRDAYGRIEGDQDATTDNLPEGATNLYFTAQRVRDVVLTGLSLVSDAAITAADTVLSAFGKLQAQITAIVDALSDYVPTSRTIDTAAPLVGGGNLSADRTISISAATSGGAGSMSAADKAKLDLVTSGTYTPSPAGIGNIASVSSADIHSFIQVGNCVALSGAFNVLASSALTFTNFEFDVPVPSNFTTGPQAGGTITWNQGSSDTGAGLIASNRGANKLSASFISPSSVASNITVRYTVVYPILP